MLKNNYSSLVIQNWHSINYYLKRTIDAIKVSFENIWLGCCNRFDIQLLIWLR